MSVAENYPLLTLKGCRGEKDSFSFVFNKVKGPSSHYERVSSAQKKAYLINIPYCHDEKCH